MHCKHSHNDTFQMLEQTANPFHISSEEKQRRTCLCDKIEHVHVVLLWFTVVWVGSHKEIKARVSNDNKSFCCRWNVLCRRIEYTYHEQSMYKYLRFHDNRFSTSPPNTILMMFNICMIAAVKWKLYLNL